MNSFVVAAPNKCIGCRTCEVACVVAHSSENIFTSTKREIEFNPRLSVVKTAAVSAPIQCRHCEDAPCANACSEGCIVNKEGVIYINQRTCIGCKTCILACPFGAIEMAASYEGGEKKQQAGLKCDDGGKLCFKEKMVANKCDLCLGREGGPACMEVCPTDALRIVNSDVIAGAMREKRRRSVIIRDYSYL
ncbi:hydrogenase-4 component A [Desulfosporosinus acididurans]|uniref:Hydrogenase-4 component A n=1 Tax=Desulfosporosinus acididurans TaxID=476652 RepID=A0A0J1FSG5_9FIRM|nr:4Fe-4S dicluster domain-containing protein [Desulfosporosinus acididurans]KLU65923.1 hydrogenase-4 component A [Desulfosporosinus acididurans]